MKETKLSPKIKVGCTKCNGIQLEDLDFSSVNFKVSPSKKVTSIVAKPKKSSKVISLF